MCEKRPTVNHKPVSHDLALSFSHVRPCGRELPKAEACIHRHDQGLGHTAMRQGEKLLMIQNIGSRHFNRVGASAPEGAAIRFRNQPILSDIC